MATASKNEFKLTGFTRTEYPLSAVTFSCNLCSELSAADLEIRWFKETECIYLYKNRQVTEGRGYEGRVSLFTNKLDKGNVSLKLRNCSLSDVGYYLCQVTDGDRTEELTVKMSSDLGTVFTDRSDRKWTNEERLKMEKSYVLAEHKSSLGEFKSQSIGLEKSEKKEELKNIKLVKELHDKNNQIQEMTMSLEQQKTELAEKHKQLQEKHKQLKENEKQLKENEKQLKENEKQLKENEKQLKENEKQLQENEKQLQEKDKQLQEKDKQLQEKDNQLQEKDKQLQEKNKQLQEKHKQLQENEKQLQEKDKQLQEKDKQLQEKNKQLQEKHKQLQEKHKQLQENEKQLQEKDKQIQEKERFLSERAGQQMEKDKHEEEEPQERTDPDLSVPIRRTNSMDFPPLMSGESSGADPPESAYVTELRVVLLGRSGSGKTEAGNTILGREERSLAGTSTPTQQCESTQVEVAGRKLTVMETFDWFCPKLPLDKLRQDVERCIHLSAPGPHAFLLVLPVNQATGEERGMLEKMEEIFGDRCWRNSMILFTVSDELQKDHIEAFIQSGNQEVQRLVEKCGNRFHCINVKKGEDSSQVSELLEKIEKMERFYSSEIYLETKSQIRAMEERILNERKVKMVKEQREMKEKLEREVRESLRKIEGVIQDHERDIRQLEDRTTELERKMKEERDEEEKRELEKELEREVERRTVLEKKVNRLKEKQVNERREMEKKHEQNMKDEEAQIAAERNLMKIIIPVLQRSYFFDILASKTKMQEEFSRQMEAKDLETKKLKQRLSETHAVLEEVYETTVKSNAEAVGTAPVEPSKGISQTFRDPFQ